MSWNLIKSSLKRLVGIVKEVWKAIPQEYKKYIIGIWLIIIGNLPVWKLFSFGSYVQAGSILGGILYMFSDNLGGLLSKKERPKLEKKTRSGYCSKCGKKLKKKDDFCSKCGTGREI